MMKISLVKKFDLRRYLKYLISYVNFLLAKKYIEVNLFFMSFIFILFYSFM